VQAWPVWEPASGWFQAAFFSQKQGNALKEERGNGKLFFNRLFHFESLSAIFGLDSLGMSEDRERAFFNTEKVFFMT